MELKSLFFPAKAQSTWWLGISNTWKRVSDRRQVVWKKPCGRNSPTPHSPLVLGKQWVKDPQLPKASSGTWAAEETFTAPPLAPESSTAHVAYGIRALNAKELSHKLLTLVMQAKEKSRAKEWPWRSVRHTALGTEPVPLHSSGAGGRRGWRRR